MSRTEKKAKEKKTFKQWICGLKTWQKITLAVATVLVLALLILGIVAYGYLNSIVDEMHEPTPEDYDLSLVDVDGYINILLLGVDSRDMSNLKGTRSDMIMIASINKDTNDVKLTSVYRDTYLNVGKDEYDKCNAAYAIGGPVQSMSMINTNLDLDITRYVAVDFKALVKAIDLLGGLDVDLSYEEIVHMNNYCVETSEKTGVDYKPIEEPDPKPENEAEILGSYHLNGVQATSYCRIRYTQGWDMKRTERQRYIISLMVDKAKKASISQLNDLMDEVFPLIKTNFSKSELLKLGMGILSYELKETQGFPKSSIMGEDVKSAIGLDCVVPTTLEANVKQLHAFLFEEETYSPSSIVLERSDYIAGHTGFGNSWVSDELKSYITERESTYTGDSAGSQESYEAEGYSDTSGETGYEESYDDDSYYDDSSYEEDSYEEGYEDYAAGYDDTSQDYSEEY